VHPTSDKQAVNSPMHPPECITSLDMPLQVDRAQSWIDAHEPQLGGGVPRICR